jgi:diacylglycerol kinase family enzyme
MGNKLLCAADAKMDDGYLDVSVYDGMGKVALAEHFLAAAGGEASAVPTYRARGIRIVADTALPSSSDMNILATRHVVEITVVPHTVRVSVGNGVGLTTPVAAAPDAPPFAPDPPFVAPVSEPAAPAQPSLEG